MVQEDSLFEQIMKSKRSKSIKPRTQQVSPDPNKKTSLEQLNELDIRYKNVEAESLEPSMPHKRVLEIRKEMSQIRKLKKEDHML
ncbi:hypothetical protein JNUCC31_00985 [Paenibacillus sp. JNUCC31]|uniref:hypothetical protein n=1 Tax=Paenibacillus sp. JNUCC-31 TaxID=2777983 RepID=UPI00177B96BD|nr:hypothetical protein [Paenibacillus sp. JNUCC-31]QOS79569.1 hypothetical protein JNUCC31_00985 [Paenibacillus sp. JNUCC-31]